MAKKIGRGSVLSGTSQLAATQQAVEVLAVKMRSLRAELIGFMQSETDINKVQEKFNANLSQSRIYYQEMIDMTKKAVSENALAAKSNDSVRKASISLEKSLGGLSSAFSGLISIEKQLVAVGQATTKGLATEQEAYEKRTEKTAQTRLRDAKGRFTSSLKDYKDRVAAEQRFSDDVNRIQLDSIKKLKYSQRARLFAIQQERKNETAEYTEKKNMLRKMWADMLLQLRTDAKKADAEQKKISQSFGNTFRDAFSPKAIGNAVANLVKYIGLYQLYFLALRGIQEITIGAVKEFIKFERELGNVAAVTGATKTEMIALKESALAAAAATRFTAPQIAELETSLAKLGATASQIPGLILPTAQAAQALGESLDKTGETILKVNNQFGLSSYESAKTAQTLVAAINESALSLESFNTAIQYIGPIAKQAGLTFNETAGYMRILSDNGFTASRIGTGLRKIFVDLKETGVDLNVTLDKLAKENISVKEALELVDIRAAAQLITLVRSRREYSNITEEVKSFTSVLEASASQMATASGAVDILNSAWQNLKISIGESLYQSELFLKVIDLIDAKSGRLARGYQLLEDLFSIDRQMAERNAGFMSGLTEELIEGTINEYEFLATALNKAGKDVDNEFTKRLALLREEFGLTFAEASNILTNFVASGSAGEFRRDWKEALDGAGIDADRLIRTLVDIDPLGFDTMELRRQAGEFIGVIELIREQRRAISDANAVEEKRIDLVAKYDGLFAQLASDQLSFEAKKLKATEAQVEIQEKLADAQERLEKEQRKKGLASKREIMNLEAETSAYGILLDKLAEYTETLLGNKALKFDEAKRQFEIDKRALDLEREALEQQLKDIETAKSARLKEFQQRKALSLQTIQSEQDKAAMLEKLNQEEREIILDTASQIEGVNNKLAGLSDKASKVFEKYRKIFQSYVNTRMEDADPEDIISKTSVKARQAIDALTNSVEQFSQTMIKAVASSGKMTAELMITPYEQANMVLKDGMIIIEAFKESLSEIGEGYGDNARQQYQAFQVQTALFERIKTEIDKIQQKYLELYAVTLATQGKAVADAVYGPTIDALAILGINLNSTAKDMGLNGSKMEELRKSFKLLGDDINGVAVIIDLTWKDALVESLQAAADAIQRFNETTYQNTKASLDAQLDAVKDRYDREDDILQSKLDNQLISEDEYRSRLKKSRLKEAQETNRLERAQFEAERKRDRQNAFTDYLGALASIIPNLILNDKIGNPIDLSLRGALSAALATTAYGLELSSINQRKFYPRKVFATGGIVQGPSHEQGGIPFTVRGEGGYEMEGGEYIINKDATKRYKTLLDQINGYGVSTYSYANGGIVNSNNNAAQKQLMYLEAIAEATVGTAINTAKPIRSFVTSSDLQSNDTERRLRERNKNL